MHILPFLWLGGEKPNVGMPEKNSRVILLFVESSAFQGKLRRAIFEWTRAGDCPMSKNGGLLENHWISVFSEAGYVDHWTIFLFTTLQTCYKLLGKAFSSVFWPAKHAPWLETKQWQNLQNHAYPCIFVARGRETQRRQTPQKFTVRSTVSKELTFSRRTSETLYWAPSRKNKLKKENRVFALFCSRIVPRRDNKWSLTTFFFKTHSEQLINK